MIDYAHLSQQLGYARYLKRAGDSVEGAVLRIEVIASQYGNDDKHVARLHLDTIPDGIIISGPLYRELEAVNAQDDGQRWRITRGEQLPGSNGKAGMVPYTVQPADSSNPPTARPAAAPARLQRPTIPAW